MNTKLTAATSSVSSPLRSALIIAGAAGKGAYAAGALSTLARDRRFDVRCLVGASSGALNAAVFAAGLRAGLADEAADQLCELWRKQASWYRIMTHTQRVAIVRDALELFRSKAGTRDVALEVVVASLTGQRDAFGQPRFEQRFEFETADFQSKSGIAKIAEVCVLSSTIPLVFPPREFGGEGKFWDGGIVNNTPIGNALKRDRAIDHMVVITPDSLVIDPSKRYGWLSFNRLLEMIIEERLARDLYEAKSFNEELARLCRAGVELGKLAPGIQWKLLQFVEIRPTQELPGSLATGFFRPTRREQYVTMGKNAAARVLDEWTPIVFDTKVAQGAVCPCAASLQLHSGAPASLDAAS